MILLCLVSEKIRESKALKLYVTFFFNNIWRYVAQGKGILQPHTFLDEIDHVFPDDESKEMLSSGPFGEVIKSAQVNFPSLLSTLLDFDFDFDFDFFLKRKLKIISIINSNHFGIDLLS